jgi:hypothetical protein
MLARICTGEKSVLSVHAVARTLQEVAGEAASSLVETEPGTEMFIQ